MEEAIAPADFRISYAVLHAPVASSGIFFILRMKFVHEVVHRPAWLLPVPRCAGKGLLPWWKY